MEEYIQINVPHFAFYVNTYFHMTFLSVQFIGKYSKIKCFTLVNVTTFHIQDSRYKNPT